MKVLQNQYLKNGYHLVKISNGKKAIVGASSVITQNVKSGSLALTRSKQTELKNYR